MERSAFVLMVGLGSVCAVGCGDAEAPGARRAATAVLRIHLTEPVIYSPDPVRYDAAEFTAYRNSMKGLLTTDLVLRAALESPELQSIPALESFNEPLKWLGDRLDVRLPEESGVMEFCLFDDELPDDDLRRVLDAVVDAFMREIVDRDTQRSQQTRELLRTASQRFRERYEDLEATYNESVDAIRGESNEAAAKRAVIMAELQELLRTKRTLENRIADELMQFQIAQKEADSRGTSSPINTTPRTGRENFALAADPPQQMPSHHRQRFDVARVSLAHRLKRIDEAEQKLEHELAQLSDPNPAATIDKRELEMLAQFIEMLEHRILVDDVNLLAPPRVVIIQRAVIE